MNLPFGLTNMKDTFGKRKEESTEAAALYERKLAEYRDALENYKRCILEYSGKLDGYDKRSMDNQLSIVQTALDMTYLKEQGDKTAELLNDVNRLASETSRQLEDMMTGPVAKTSASMESLAASILQTNYKLEGLDKNVVNRLSELLLELQKQVMYQNKQLQAEAMDSIDRLTHTVKKGHAILWFVLAFNLLGLSALAFLILYIMEIIPF
jgi:chromosome segregation ATPase